MAKYINKPVSIQTPQSTIAFQQDNMVKSKSNRMHLKVNNDPELDINNALTAKRNRKSLLFNTIRKKV